MKNSMALALSLLLGAPVWSGCGQAEKPGAPQESILSTNAAPTEATVELSASQLGAIKIEPVGTGLFPVEAEAVGSVSFDEDPAIVQAESTLLGAMSTLLGARATRELTDKELARVKSLGETNGIAQKELEQAASEDQTAEAAVKRADAALKAARDALRALGKTDVDIDAMMAAGKIPAALADPEARQRRSTWVTAYVSETDSPRVRAGQTVQVTVPAWPGRVFDGKISRVYGTIDPNTHRLTIRCEVEDAQSELRPGMLAEVVVRVREPVAATAIPADGVVRESDGTMTAWVTTDRKRFVQKTVKLGRRADGRVQILDGLQPGELAVTEGAVFLSNLLNAPPSD